MSMSNKVGKLSFFIKHTKSFAMASLYFFSFLHSTSAAMLLSNVNVASNFSQDFKAVVVAERRNRARDLSLAT